jgi:hypothetical protein
MGLKASANVPKTDREWQQWCAQTGLDFIHRGTGSPEGIVTAPAGNLYLRLDGGAGTTLYVKETGVGPTGWAAK